MKQRTLEYATWALSIAVALGLLMTPPAAAGPSPKAAPKKVLSKSITAQGRLRVARSVSGRVVQLSDAKGKRWLLSGKWRKELLRLNNHQVKVWGKPGKKKLLQPTLLVTRYALVRISGRKPLIGLLRKVSGGAGVALKQKDTTTPIKGGKAFLKRLRRRLGCKIWIVGDKADGALKAFKFGWLRCGKRPPMKTKPKRKENRR